MPTLRLELDLWKKGFLVVGIDEVGRGCFAGPLVVGAAVIKPDLNKTSLKRLLELGVNDSKKLSIPHRELINKSVREFIFDSELQYITVEVINEIGIGKSTTVGFNEVAKKITTKHKNQKIFFLTDAFKLSSTPAENQLNIIRGDETSISIAAASIIAKVHRDDFMAKLSNKYPLYSLAQNKGYGTLIHRNAIKQYGACEIHRKDFIAGTLEF